MINTQQTDHFKENGFLLMEGVFSPAEIEIIKTATQQVVVKDSPKRILEKNGSLRSFFAAHEDSPILDTVGKLERIVVPAKKILGQDVYIYQTKINCKEALAGDWWEWHQDFAYWHKEDGMPDSKVLTAMIFLDEVNEFNGPLLLIPGSHKAGLVDLEANEIAKTDGWFDEYQKSTTYMTNLTSNLKYTIKRDSLIRLLNNQQIFSAKASAGSVLFFDGLVFHASSNNLSPWKRETYLITYNSVDNALPERDNPRPDFLANKNSQPITPTKDDKLMSYQDVAVNP